MANIRASRVQFNIIVERSTQEELRRIAAEEDISLGKIVRDAIGQYLARREAKP